MTGAEFSGVDVDLLADYVGGALDGTPDEARVADLIVEDPSWRDAHALLAGGVATVGLQLRALDSVPEPMPDDIFARLDAALTAASTTGDDETTDVDDDLSPPGRTRPVASAGVADAEVEPIRIGLAPSVSRGDDERDVARSDDATVSPAGMEPGNAGVAPVRQLDAVRNRRRARHLRWAAPIGIAAGVIAFVGFGLQQARDDSSQDSGSTTAAAPQEAARAGGSDLALPALPDPTANVVSSGLDYQQATLRQVSAQAIGNSSAENRSFSSGKSAGPALGALDEAADPLSRLRVQQALLECIDAISTANGAGAISPRTVDFARYDGAPAVVVEFAARNGTWVWAAGAECGTPAGGADKLAAVQVG